jgi:hypothetical protein
MLTKKVPKNAEKYICENCNFECSKKSNYDKHILTAKHKRLTMLTKKMPKNAENDKIKFVCECGKIYLQRQSLYRHKQKCMYVEDENIDNTITTNQEEIPLSGAIVVNELLKQNQEFKEIIKTQNEIITKHHENQQAFNEKIITSVEEGKLGNTTNTTNNTNNTTNNNTTNFNLNFFLNDTCKDALNITDFVNSLQLQLKDLEQTGSLGHVNGISRIFLNALKDIDETERPFHCTDSKRETLYIKDDDKWMKDDNKTKLKSAINTVTNKNAEQISLWCEENPACGIMNSEENAKFSEITLNSLGPAEEEEYNKNNEKIAKNIMKNITISK